MASDGIFDKISNKEAIECTWNSVKDCRLENVHQQVGMGVEYIIKNALLRRTLDNVTVVIIAFDNFLRETQLDPLSRSHQQFQNQDISLCSNQQVNASVQIKKRYAQMNNTDTNNKQIIGNSVINISMQQKDFRTQNSNLSQNYLFSNKESFRNISSISETQKYLFGMSQQLSFHQYNNESNISDIHLKKNVQLNIDFSENSTNSIHHKDIQNKVNKCLTTKNEEIKQNIFDT